MEKEEIRVVLKLKFCPERAEPWKAVIKAFLPSEYGLEDLKTTFRAPEVEFWGEKLKRFWGTYDEGYRIRSEFIYAESASLALEKAKEYMKAEIQKLIKVAEKNRELMQKETEKEYIFYV